MLIYGIKKLKLAGLIARIHRQLATDPWSNVKRARPGTSAALDLGSVIIDCGDKHYNTVGGKGIPECYLKAWPVTPRVA